MRSTHPEDDLARNHGDLGIRVGEALLQGILDLRVGYSRLRSIDLLDPMDSSIHRTTVAPYRTFSSLPFADPPGVSSRMKY